LALIAGISSPQQRISNENEEGTIFMAVDAFAQDVLADNPVGYWRFGEASGTVAADSSPHGHTGTYNGAITLGQQLRPLLGGDTAARFDGAAGIVTVPNTPELNPPRITIEAIVRWDGPTGMQQRIVEKESYATKTQYGLSVMPDGHVFVELRCNVPTDHDVVATSLSPVAPAPDGTHIVATYDGQQICIYLDGDLDSVTVPGTGGTIDTSKAGNTNDPEVDLAIGDRKASLSNPAGGTRTFKGLIDEVAIYDTVLPWERVHAHYQSQFAMDTSLQYATKVVCGVSPGKVVAKGAYWTAINVHNPNRTAAAFRWKVAVALPGVKAGPVSKFFDARLGPDEALEIDCPDVMKRVKTDGFLKGFVVIESGLELDIVAVYTAAPERGEVVTLHTERVPARRLATPIKRSSGAS
jgi:hypothetical protein